MYVGDLADRESSKVTQPLGFYQNTIGTIENLNCLPSLRFLILAHNEILHVGGLSSLSHLQLLDLTHNAIEIVNAGEFAGALETRHCLDGTYRNLRMSRGNSTKRNLFDARWKSMCSYPQLPPGFGLNIAKSGRD